MMDPFGKTMRGSIRQKIVFLAIAGIVIAQLSICMAQSDTHSYQNFPPPPPSGGLNASPEWQNSLDEHREHQGLREEAQRLRESHVELETAREQLHERCGQRVAEDPICAEEMMTLRQRREALHDRVKVLHEHIRALRERTGLGAPPPPPDGDFHEHNSRDFPPDHKPPPRERLPADAQTARP